MTCLRTLSEISSDGMYIWALEFMCAVAIDYKGILSDRRPAGAARMRPHDNCRRIERRNAQRVLLAKPRAKP